MLVLLSVTLHLPAFVGGGSRIAETRSRSRFNAPVDVSVVPWGPSQTRVDSAIARIQRDEALRRRLEGNASRLVAFEQIENGKNPPKRFRAFFYDYTNDRTVVAESGFSGKEPVIVTDSDFVPGVAQEEIDAARTVISNDSSLGPKMRARNLDIYEAMPPVSVIAGERLVNIGVTDFTTGENRIVGISFKTGKVVDYPNNAPPTSRAVPESCGIPSAGQGSTSSGVSGQYQLTATQNGEPIWQMLVIRPSSSSGAANERSGIEIRDVRYRGKTVLKRGHAPILNVKYLNDSCGPFRDWQYSEGYFSIPTSGVTYPNGVGGGIAVLPAGGVATTVIESREDAGNFQGVAIYQQDVGNGNELVLVTEMNAGWYRYIMEWRFGNDGVIRPRYGFGSISNSCVCNERTHHVYWRLDFDIVQPLNKVLLVERGRRFLRPITAEAALFKSYQVNRSLMIQNSDGDEAYQLVPGSNDGAITNAKGTLLDPFAVGDFWILKYAGTSLSPSEIDDPNPFGTHTATISPWVGNESVLNQDVVIWYAAHQTRIDDASLSQWSENILSGKHIVGPEIRPVRW